MEPVEAEQEVIRLARELRANGMSLRSVAKALASMGHVSRSGRPFHAEQIDRLIKSTTTAVEGHHHQK